MHCINLFNTIKTILLKIVFIPKLINSPVASCYIINIDFLLSHTAHFDKSFIIPFLVLATFELLLSVFFQHFKQHDKVVF